MFTKNCERLKMFTTPCGFDPPKTAFFTEIRRLSICAPRHNVRLQDGLRSKHRKIKKKGKGDTDEKPDQTSWRSHGHRNRSGILQRGARRGTFRVLAESERARITGSERTKDQSTPRGADHRTERQRRQHRHDRAGHRCGNIERRYLQCLDIQRHGSGTGDPGQGR